MANYSPQLQIDTPENVLIDADIAGFGTRCVASIIDYLIIGGIVLVIVIIYTTTLAARISNQTLGTGLLILFIFMLTTFYHLFFEFLWNGQTPGKRRLNLRVVQMDGLPLTTNAALVRNLVRLFDFFPVLYGVGLIAMFASKNTQRLGDMAAGTIVIRERPQLTLETVKENWFVEYEHISRYDPIPPQIDIARLTENDRRDVVSYLRRRAQLINRGQLAGMLATGIAEKMIDSQISTDLRLPVRAETFLEYVARAFEVEEATRS